MASLQGQVNHNGSLIPGGMLRLEIHMPVAVAAAPKPTLAPDPTEAVAKTATAVKMFKFSEWIDFGDGAAECEHARDGECDEGAEGHFHAWVRLPNDLQNKDLREKGWAAKARRARLYRNRDSDPSVVMDGELAELDDPAFRSTIIDELLRADWAQHYTDAQRTVEQQNEEFETIDQDREEFGRLSQTQGLLPEDEQSPEFRELSTHLQQYVEAVNKELENLQRPQREELESRSLEALIELLRARRVDVDCGRAFDDTYNNWLMYVGTYQVALHETLRRPHVLKFTEIGDPLHPEPGTIAAQSPELIDALRAAFMRLRLALHQGSTKNS